MYGFNVNLRENVIHLQEKYLEHLVKLLFPDRFKKQRNSELFGDSKSSDYQCSFFFFFVAAILRRRKAFHLICVFLSRAVLLLRGQRTLVPHLDVKDTFVGAESGWVLPVLFYINFTSFSSKADKKCLFSHLGNPD